MAYQMATKYDPGASKFELIVFPRGGAQIERPRWHGSNFRVKRDKNEGAGLRIVMNWFYLNSKPHFGGPGFIFSARYRAPLT